MQYSSVKKNDAWPGGPRFSSRRTILGVVPAGSLYTPQQRAGVVVKAVAHTAQHNIGARRDSRVSFAHVR